MTDRWTQAKAIFEELLDLAPEQREAYLDRACGADAELRDEVRSLAEAHDGAEDFLTGAVSSTIVNVVRDAVDRAGNATTGDFEDAPIPRVCPACKKEFKAPRIVCPNDGSLLVNSPTALVGIVLDGLYRITGLLGQGGMGAVFLAEHVLIGDRVAIKTITDTSRGSGQNRRRFIREAKATRAISHPNLIRVLDLRVSDETGMLYMVMEYIDGVTLRNELKRQGKFTIHEALDVLSPVADALDAAHRQNIVHRDLKPENIMIGEMHGERVVKLLDLGIAKLRDLMQTAESDPQTSIESPLTTSGQIIGTPHYMSPEQWGIVPSDGEVDIDGRADIYGLAVVLFELIAGVRPFEGGSFKMLQTEHLFKKPRLLHEMAEGVPVKFGVAVARAMAKDRVERPATAGEFFKELVQILEDDARSDECATNITESNLEAFSGEVSPAERAPLADLSGDDDVQTPETMVATPEAIPAATGSRRIVAASALGATLLGAGLWTATTQGWLGGGRQIPSSVGGSARPDVRQVDVLRFFLERQADGPGASPVRVSANDAIPAGKPFALHFIPAQSGYFYIVSPGDRNVPTVLLSGDGVPGSIGANYAAANADFRFPPSSSGTGLSLDGETVVTTFTVVFSPTQLAEPALLTRAQMRLLSESEQQDWGRFVQSLDSSQLVVREASDSEVDTVVSAIGKEAFDRPVVFRVALKSAR